MASGCGCKEVYIIISSYFLSLYTPLLSALFSADRRGVMFYTCRSTHKRTLHNLR